MCGIIAVYDEEQINKSRFAKMRDTMTHRGPDAAGSEFFEHGKTALGHRRLSIIDLSDKGKQPMSNENGTVWLSYNGEIYNFMDLRSVLEAKGHIFRSRTDSEVIVHAYEEWGESCVDKLWGMFAFVIWDDNRKILYGARDRLGVKPLHYYLKDKCFICASEIKAIVEDTNVSRDINIGAVCDFLTYRYIPAPKTVWKNIHKLPPAHAFVYSDSGLRTWRYWTLNTGEEIISEKRALEHLGGLFEDAVKRRLVSDVPHGLFLSGGLDSSAVAWEMKQLEKNVDSFTIGFEGIDDETADAQMVADFLNTNHHVQNLSVNELEQLSTLMWYFDEPFGASSMLPTFLVSKTARKHVTVALSGDGGDEAFAGYNWYDTLLNPMPARKGIVRLTKLLGLKNARSDSLAERYRQTTTPRFNRGELKNLFCDFPAEIEDSELWFFEEAINPEITGIKQLQWLDTHTFLPEEVLTKVDRASMANSLEVRSPFLDHRLFEWTFSLSEKVYFGGEKKRLVKKLLRDNVPDSVITKPKRGFSAPVSIYWSSVRINSILSESRAVNDGLFNRSFINRLLKHTDSPAIYSNKWLLMVFELWYRQWVAGS